MGSGHGILVVLELGAGVRGRGCHGIVGLGVGVRGRGRGGHGPKIRVHLASSLISLGATWLLTLPLGAAWDPARPEVPREATHAQGGTPKEPQPLGVYPNPNPTPN